MCLVQLVTSVVRMLQKHSIISVFVFYVITNQMKSWYQSQVYFGEAKWGRICHEGINKTIIDLVEYECFTVAQNKNYYDTSVLHRSNYCELKRKTTKKLNSIKFDNIVTKTILLR